MGQSCARTRLTDVVHAQRLAEAYNHIPHAVLGDYRCVWGWEGGSCIAVTAYGACRNGAMCLLG
jgi:hypothetical protein